MAYPEQPPTGSMYDQPTQVQPQPQAWAPPRRSHRGLIIALVAAIVLVAAGTSVYLFVFNSVTIKGSFAVAGAGAGFGTAECRGSGGHSDLAAGTSVTISDASGKTIALGRLGAGRVVGAACVFDFSIDAPRSDFYGIEVSHRGVVKFSRAEAEAGVTLGLGY